MKLSNLLLAFSALALVSLCSAIKQGLRQNRKMGEKGRMTKKVAVGKNGNALKGPPSLVPSCDTHILPAYDPNNGKPILYAGHTYEEWANLYVLYLFSYNASVSPFLHNTTQTSQYETDLLQPKGTFFLPASFGGTYVRRLRVPKDTTLFFTVLNFIHAFRYGLDDDLKYLQSELKLLGINAGNLKKTEANSILEATLLLTANMTNINTALEVDGCSLNPVQNGLIVTLPDHGFSLPVVPSLGIPPNFYAAQAGFYVLLPPFRKPGTHTIHFSSYVNQSGPIEAAGNTPFGLDITYYLTVV